MTFGRTVTHNPVNAWRERGYDDGRALRPARHPLNATDEQRAAYAAGYRRGRESKGGAS